MNFFIVDDDPDMIALMSTVLEHAGHVVQSSTSSIQALKQIALDPPDCVLTDIMMPEMDGFELCNELCRRPEFKATRIIVLSAKPYDFDRRRAKELGADGYIVKPIHPDTLMQSITAILSEQIAVTYWGVHGTLPVPGPGSLRYGGNTPCISVEVSGEPIYVFDCGSGIKQLSDQIMASKVPRLSARIFISHTHWDHINTFPFFAPFTCAAI